MRFRKKPVVIEAWQVNAPGEAPAEPPPDWLVIAISNGHAYAIKDGGLLIYTLEGTMRADVGDFVIQGVSGELYPCKPQIFAATYEPAE